MERQLGEVLIGGDFNANKWTCLIYVKKDDSKAVDQLGVIT